MFLVTPWSIYRQVRRGIPSHKYTRSYFLSDRCDGFREFQAGRRLSYVKQRLIDKVDPRPGERIIEIGCGRGEVLRACADAGASAVGVDYSRDATLLSRETCSGSAIVIRADTIELPLHGETFHKAFLGDVLEHLTREDARRMIAEVHRVLKRGGTLVLHTSPNVFFMHLILPCVMLALLVTGRFGLLRHFARQYRASWEYHVREYSPGRLRRLFQDSRFRRADVICDADLLRSGKSPYTASLASRPAIRALSAFGSRKPFRNVLSNDLWVVAKKPR